MERNDKIKAFEVRTDIAWEAHLLAKKMRHILDLYESVENEDYVCDWFSEDYPFHLSFDEIIFEVENWAETLEKTEKMFKKKTEGLVCPYCGSRNWTYYDSTENDNRYVREVECNNCNKHYKDVYDIKYSGYIDEHDIEYNHNGCELYKENKE